MPELQPLAPDHLDAVIAFELENRAYFGRFINDRGDAFYADLPGQHATMLAEQAAGTRAFYVLVEADGSILGRINLYDINAVPGSASVGYRIAERAAGRGLASAAVTELLDRAAEDHHLEHLNAKAATANAASQRVLEKAGFSVVGNCEVIPGTPGVSFHRALRRGPV